MMVIGKRERTLRTIEAFHQEVLNSRLWGFPPISACCDCFRQVTENPQVSSRPVQTLDRLEDSIYY